MLIVVAAVIVVVAGSVLIPGSPTRTFAHGLRGLQCLTWMGHSGGSVLDGYGDSITIANSEPQFGEQGDESWWSHLVCSGNYAAGRNAGVAGQTSAEVLARLRADRPRADVLVIEAGTNDLRLKVPLSTTVANLRAAVQEGKAAARVVVLTTVQPWLGTDATELNAAVRQLAADTGARVADFAAVLGDRAKTIDGVHPTPQAADELADLVAQAAHAH